MPLSRDPAPQRSVPIATGSMTVAPRQTSTLLYVEGCGEIDGLVLHYSGAPLVNAQLELYIDDVRYTIFLIALAAPLLLGTPATGTPTKPITVVQYDATGNNYKIAVNSPIRFARSFRLDFVNTYSGNVTVAATAVAHLHA